MRWGERPTLGGENMLHSRSLSTFNGACHFLTYNVVALRLGS